VSLSPISELNEQPRGRFAEALRPLFEAAEPLANALYDARPFRSYGELLDRAEGVALQLAEDQQVEVVNAHPPIGASPDRVSEQSYREQGYAHEAALDRAQLAETYAALAELNQAYEARFGFRFVVFVNGRPKADIVDLLRQRLNGCRRDELRTAVSELLAIARDRLRKLSHDG
jgi:2-oxo-4-hydroxy-4-carboxy-5-ureidoimidazoline decarboxylase